MKKFSITIVFIMSICLLSIPTSAQNLNKNWEIGVSGGFYFGAEKEDGILRIRDEKIESYERTIGKYAVTLDNNPIFYLVGGYRFKDYGFFRLIVGYSQFDLDVKRDQYKLPDADATAKVELIPVSMNFNYFLMRKSPFKPYISVGFTSYIFAGIQDFNVAPAVRLGADFGAGVEYYLTDSFAVTVDAGYHFLKIELQAEDPFTMRGYPQTYDEINAIPDRVEASIGLKFLVY